MGSHGFPNLELPDNEFDWREFPEGDIDVIPFQIRAGSGHDNRLVFTVNGKNGAGARRLGRVACDRRHVDSSALKIGVQGIAKRVVPNSCDQPAWDLKLGNLMSLIRCLAART
jgi:hypothetical protein